jgi:hypothetical protein
LKELTMSPSPDTPLLQRPAFFDGQQLAATDLADAQAYQRQMHWLHNRSLHGWGVAGGLGVAGAAGERVVQVGPGYALDALGRDLLLFEPQTLPVPAVAGASTGGAATYYLTASYADDAELAPVTRAGACGSAGAVRRPEQARLRWQDPAEAEPSSRYRYGLDVVLAEAQVQNCRLALDVVDTVRRNALPPQQPYVAAGRTPAGATPWKLWPSDAAAFGVSTFVSTAAAGFRLTPQYQAHVEGTRLVQALGLVEGYAQVAAPGAAGFELRVMLPAGTTAGTGQLYTFSEADRRAVVSPLVTALGLPLDQFGPALQDALAAAGPRLSVGQKIEFVGIFALVTLGPLKAEHFKPRLEQIAQGRGVTLDELLQANGWDLGTFSISVGDAVAIPGPALDLNPSAVLKPEFMDRLTRELAWHVVWVGVEG